MLVHVALRTKSCYHIHCVRICGLFFRGCPSEWTRWFAREMINCKRNIGEGEGREKGDERGVKERVESISETSSSRDERKYL
jgi:hypothetical protein